MLNSLVHNPCEISLYLMEEDIFIHPPSTNDAVSHDKTLRGIVEIKCPSERSINSIKVDLKGIQTIAIPDSSSGSSSGLRWEERKIMDKTVEIHSDVPIASTSLSSKHHKGKGKEKEKIERNREMEKKREKEKERERSSRASGSSDQAATTSSSAINGSDFTAEPTLGTMTSITAAPPSPTKIDHNAPSPSYSAPTVPINIPNSNSASHSQDGIHLEKGVHGFEFAFIIPATSAPFERAKNGRVRYFVTATAFGAGRAKSQISAQKEVFIILNVAKDGGPTPLDIQYHDVHEALGPLSVSLTSASLTVGGTATLRCSHPDPPPGLNVHVVRVFVEQTFELYSSHARGWIKLPSEKLRIWERGSMPYKKDKPHPFNENLTANDPNINETESLWVASEEEGQPGKPGNAIGSGASSNTLSPFGLPINGGSASVPNTPGEIQLPNSSNQGGSSNETKLDGGGYKLRSVVRLPDDNSLRPSTVKGCRAEIRVTHEMGVEVFFSRLSVLDPREGTEAFGRPKVQVFSMRRATTIPSCCCTFDTIHLPPYSFDSPNSSRPASPIIQPSLNNFSLTHPHSNNQSSENGRSGRKSNGNISELDHWKLTTTLREALPHSVGGIGGSRASSRASSRPNSRPTSREPSPTRGASSGHHSPSDNFQNGESQLSTSASSSNSHGWKRPHKGRSHSGFGWGNGLHGFTPASSTSNSHPASSSHTPHHQHQNHNAHSNAHHPNPKEMNSGSFSTHSYPNSGSNSPIASLSNSSSHHHHNNITSGFSSLSVSPSSPSIHPHPSLSGPKSLPANSPWVYSNQPSRTGQSHSTCNCGRSTAELIEAESRLLLGAPTAPGTFIDQAPSDPSVNLPPTYTPSRPSSPDENAFGNGGSSFSTGGKEVY